MGAMRAAGCRLVMFGLETGSQRLLDRLGKRMTLEQCALAVRIARQAGLKVAAGFMLGLPTETEEETKRTIAFARRLKLDYAWFNLAEPYPGTSLWEDAVANGRFLDPATENPIEGAPGSASVWVPAGRSRQELRRWLRVAAAACAKGGGVRENRQVGKASRAPQ
jgi:radical SAM superfamily enzyme YgiQ (UPF0313 family)